MPPVATPAANQMTPDQLNSAQRRLVVQQSVKMRQNIYSGTINPALGNVIQIVPRNVGLILRFIVEVSATYTNSGSQTNTLTDMGAQNLITNFQFTDLQNNQRINTYGYHLGLVSSFKERQAYASAATLASAEMNFGNNYPVLTAPETLATTVAGTLRTVYEVPIAYSDEDLRGAIYANVVANQMQLQLTINPNPTTANTADDTLSIYHGPTGAAGTLSNVVINIYQEYYDQLPVGQNGVVLPILDIATVYQLLYSPFNNIAAGQDFYVQYTNFRRYLSVIGVFNNSGNAGGRSNGSDVNYWAQVSSNFTNIWKNDPLLQAQLARRILGVDPPPGVYYFPSRQKPIYTLTYGNMQIDLNPITAGANAYLIMLWEFMSLQNTLSSAGSLPANG
jgi:hypothetical protein